MYRIIAALCACFVAFCSASNTVDVADIAVGVIETVPQVAISKEDLAKWLEESDWQQCVEQQIMDLFTRTGNPLVSQCSSVVSELSSGSGGSSGDGDGDDPESEAVPFHVISEVFCSRACGQVLLEVYDSCGLFKNPTGQRVGSVLVESCSVNSKGVQCLDALASFPVALHKCTADSCTSDCKDSLEQTVEAAGCCLHFANMSLITSETEMGSGSGTGAEGATSIALSDALESCNIAARFADPCQNSPLKLPGQVVNEDGSSAATATLNYFIAVVCFLVTGLSVSW